MGLPTIRAARAEDDTAIARVNIATWRSSFRGIVPDDYLDLKLGSPEHLGVRAETLRKRLDSGGLVGMFVAELDGEIVGFTDSGTSKFPELPFAGEIYAIYVLQGHQRSGIGRLLMTSAVEYLLGEGLNSMVIKTLAASPYRTFYEKLGGVIQPDRGDLVIERGGVRLPLVVYGWADLEVLKTHLGISHE